MNPGLDRYDALICDPDIANRIRLKTVITAVPKFGRLSQCTSLAEATELSGAEMTFDVIFLSTRIPQEEITKFVEAARGRKQTQDAAFIIVLSGYAQDSSTVAQTVMKGADGVLFEPYSVDSLIGVTEISKKVKRERSQAREAAALGLVLNNVISQVDLVSQLKSGGIDLGPNFKKLREMCTVFRTLSKESFENYINVAISKFGNASVPVIGKKKYTGVSDRVKKKLEEKHRAELVKKSGANPDGTV